MIINKSVWISESGLHGTDDMESNHAAGGEDSTALEDIDCKIVLVGDSRCGKTSLVQRFISDKFAEVSLSRNNIAVITVNTNSFIT